MATRPNPVPGQPPVPDFSPAAILAENLGYLSNKAAYDNRRVVDEFNTARHNYQIQSETGTPPSTNPTSLVWETVNIPLAIQLFESQTEVGAGDPSSISIESAIVQTTLDIPANVIVAIAADGSLQLTPDPSYHPAVPPPANPLGGPVAPTLPNIVHAVPGDPRKAGDVYQAPDNTKWDRLDSIVWGPIYVKET